MLSAIGRRQMRAALSSLNNWRSISTKMSGDAQQIRTSLMSNDDAKWVHLKRIDWRDQDGKARVWEMAERSTRSGDCDAVAIFAVIRTQDQPPQTVLTKQYRPPIDKLCIELPAGLIDKGESAEEAAVRELKEETGYVGKVIESTPIVWNDPGLTNANMQLVTIEVDTAEGENAHPVATPEEGEHIELMLVPLAGLWAKLQDLERQGFGVDARLAHMAMGMNTEIQKTMKAAVLLAALSLLAHANITPVQQTLQFMRGDARMRPDSIDAAGLATYDVELHTRASHYNAWTRLVFYGATEAVQRAIRTAEQKSWFGYIAPFFYAEGLVGVQYQLQSHGVNFSVPVAGAAGVSVSRLELQLPASTPTGFLDISGINGAQLAGGLQLMRNDNGSFCVVSDVDDTIRVTEVLSTSKSLENTFVNPFRSTKNFPAFYRHLHQSLRDPHVDEHAAQTATFHYVSGGPHQLYTPLHSFLSAAGYPNGAVYLRRMGSLSLELWEGVQDYKIHHITNLMHRYNKRQWVLVGDSGQLDSETYGIIYRSMPAEMQNNIRCIYIRKVTGTDPVKETILNLPTRFEAAFAGVPREKWATFFDPQEVMGANIRGGQCY
ncbi:hypothetical protein RI367_000825 [Sorochytrium milnesiophthora]